MYDQYIGVIKALGFGFVPAEWGYCGGAIIAINQFTSLFSLLGCRFGGDCQSTFGLPELRGRSPMGMGSGPSLTPRVIGQAPGWHQNALSPAEMATHSHGVTYAGGGGAATAIQVAQAGGKSSEPSGGDHLAAPADNFGTVGSNLYLAPAEASTTVLLGGVTSSGDGFDNDWLIIQPTPQATQYVNLVQPSQVVNYCICMDGLYPSRG